MDIKGPNVVKGIQLEGLRVLGKPAHFARYYYENGADELLYMDAVASLYGRNNLLDIVQRTAREIFVPLTVGGGLRTVDDIRTVLKAGADKVAINTAAIHRPELIREASQRFGSSTIVVSIETNRNGAGTYECLTDYGRERSGVDPFEWALRATELGAGELMVTSINREGTGDGFDLELTRQISEAVPIPVIACGGAGRLEHVHDVISEGRADAVAIASILHYNAVRQLDYRDDDFVDEGNIEFLQRRGELSKIQDVTLSEVKQYLSQNGVDIRTQSHGSLVS